MGKLQGEIAAFGGTFLLGGGQTKTVAKAGGLLENAAKAGTTVNNVLPQINPRFFNFGPIPAVAGKGVRVGTASRAGGITVAGEVAYPLVFNTKLEKQLVAGSYSLTQSTEKGIVRWAKNSYKEWANYLSDEEMRIIRHYTDNPNYYNDLLRGFENRKCTPSELAEIGKISEIISSAPLKEKVILFRGVDRNALGKYANYSPEELVGKVFLEKAFMSTSLLPETAAEFSYGVLLVINAPKGTKGAYIDKLSAFKGEYEFLLDKGQNMLIQKAVQGEKELILTVDLI